MSRQIINPETGDKRFDARVHVRDRQGKIVKIQPYSLICNGQQQYFLDKNTGKKYYADGTEIVEAKAPEAPKSPAPAPAPKVAAPVAPSAQGRRGGKPQPQEKTLNQAVSESNPEPALEDPEHPSTDHSGL